MKDRELLELAAKAAGYEVEFDYAGVAHNHEGSGATSWAQWNPLTDDGDALRLAVKLRIPIWFDTDMSVIANQRNCGDLGCRVETGASDLGGYAATRRAIVWAAAELGKQSNAVLSGPQDKVG